MRRAILCICALLVIGLAFNAPWWVNIQGIHAKAATSPLWKPPSIQHTVDTAQLALEILGIAMLGGIGLLITRKP